MGDLFFIIKAMLMTVVVVLVLQIKVGSTTLEQRSMMWIHESPIVDGLKGVADGAVHAASKSFGAARSAMTDRVSSETKASQFNLKKSAEYYREQWRRKRPRFEHADDSTRRPAVDEMSADSQAGSAMDSDSE